ncbi:MAG: hypothetical protein KC506_01850 [Nanoarchaeota archaeon]|nr:hypothetical protein [Nanoarchaeota archaeon]
MGKNPRPLDRINEIKTQLRYYRESVLFRAPAEFYLDNANRILILAERRGSDVSKEREEYNHLMDQHVANLARVIDS